MQQAQMVTEHELATREKSLALVGLGYVGLPLAAIFSEIYRVIGFDINAAKIATYQRGHDPTDEIGDELLRQLDIDFTADEARLREASFIIVAVPTPVNADNTPDLRPVMGASEIVGRNLTKGAIVVFESTVYPGVTEDICQPILERESGLVAGRDFWLGYSPERIRSNDKVRTVDKIVKIVSGMDAASRAVIADVYREVITEGVYEAPSMRVAEAAKLMENTQIDVNIAFMNELSRICHALALPTNEVIKAMATKWNALKYRPGLVGGHCISVDPYYLIHQSDLAGYHPRMIAAGRLVNKNMGQFVADSVLKQMLLAKVNPARAKVCLLGMTFKEDCPDTRNSLPAEIYKILTDYDLDLVATDPMADAAEFAQVYGFPLSPLSAVADADCLVVLVSHKPYREMTPAQLRARCKPDKPCVLIDVKSVYDPDECERTGFRYWSL